MWYSTETYGVTMVTAINTIQREVSDRENMFWSKFFVNSLIKVS